MVIAMATESGPRLSAIHTSSRPGCPPLSCPPANVPEVITVAASNVATKYNGTKAGEWPATLRVQLGCELVAPAHDCAAQPPVTARMIRILPAGDAEDIYKWSNTGPCMDIFAPVRAACRDKVGALQRMVGLVRGGTMRAHAAAGLALAPWPSHPALSPLPLPPGRGHFLGLRRPLPLRGGRRQELQLRQRHQHGSAARGRWVLGFAAEAGWAGRARCWQAQAWSSAATAQPALGAQPRDCQVCNSSAAAFLSCCSPPCRHRRNVPG